MIRLIVGLGNPGPEYDRTRHNAGFWLVDALARDLKVSLAPERSYHGLVARAAWQGRPLWLLEPQTYMNLSGKSVAALARFFKIEPAEILVVHDELDLLPGQVKLKLGGSHAGHNGLKDIQAQLGTNAFWRLRIGIGHPGVRAEVIDWVLQKPRAEERDAIDRVIDACRAQIGLVVDGEFEKAAMRLHTKPPKPPKPKPVPPVAATPPDPETAP